MKFSKNRILTTGLGVTLAAALVLGGGTYAYLQSTTEDVVNNFKANKVLVSLEEDTGNQYDIIPGTKQNKDPKVTVDATVPAYVYLEVTDATKDLVTYNLEAAWIPLEGHENVYYQEVEGSTEKRVLSVLVGDEVSYSAALENDDMFIFGTYLDPTIKLSFKAKAIQKEGFADAVTAYKGIPVTVKTGAELKEAMGSVEEGGTIKLEADMTLVTSGSHPNGTTAAFITTPNVTIDLNGFTLSTESSGNAKSFGLAANGLVLKNGTVKLENITNDYPLYVTTGAKDVVIEDVTILGGMQVIGNSTATLRNVDIQAYNYYDVYLEYKSTVTIESGTFKRSGEKSHIYTAQSTDKVIVKGGDFDGAATPAYAGNGTVEIENNTGN